MNNKRKREIYCVHNNNLLFLIFFWICMESYLNGFHPLDITFHVL